ncbi:MAG: hypothetical protein NT105_13580 [Verrucomicrobia bacterium]|nr:hypothetical protein [Verrucomicrobiota bacterium]
MKKQLAVAVVFMAVMVGNAATIDVATKPPPPSPEQGQYLSYETFINEVEAGLIKAVSLGEYSMTGFKTIGGKEEPFKCFARSGSSQDPLLLRLLKEKNVSISIQPAPKHEFGVWQVLWVFLPIPIVLVVVVVVFVYLVRINRKIERLLKDKPAS